MELLCSVCIIPCNFASNTVRFHLYLGASQVSCKESTCQERDASLIPGSRRSPGEGNGDPLQYSCLGNPTNRGALQAMICGDKKESNKT